MLLYLVVHLQFQIDFYAAWTFHLLTNEHLFEALSRLTFEFQYFNFRRQSRQDIGNFIDGFSFLAAIPG